jgi:hypothetical protein
MLCDELGRPRSKATLSSPSGNHRAAYIACSACYKNFHVVSLAFCLAFEDALQIRDACGLYERCL